MSKNVRWGLTLGAFLTAFFSALTMVAYAVQGGEPFENRDTTVSMVLALNAFGGMTGGLLLGLLRPLLRTRAGAGIAGTIAAFPVVLVIGFVVARSPAASTSNTLIGAVFISVILGGGAGFVFWDPPENQHA